MTNKIQWKHKAEGVKKYHYKGRKLGDTGMGKEKT